MMDRANWESMQTVMSQLGVLVPETRETPDLGAILDALVSGIEAALGDSLVGVYLRGSLALGDFNSETSDIDFLTVTARPGDEVEFTALARLHPSLAAMPNEFPDR